MTSELIPVDHPGAWRADRFAKADFSFNLGSRHLAAIDENLARIRRNGLDLYDIERQDFPLESIGVELGRWRDQVMDGYGLLILSGFDTGRYSVEDLETIHWGLGVHFGTPMSQSVMGDRMGHVVNVGGKDPKERAYRNSTELAMHTDACDVVGMMCINKAASGGQSGYVSAVAVYNEILQREPTLLPVLFEGYHYHRFGEEAPGESPVTEFRVPVFSFTDGFLSATYLRSYIDLAAQELSQPLTEQQTAALDLVDEVAHDPALALRFTTEPGEAVFFNNLTVFHNRTAFEDDSDPARRRHLLRLWLVAHQRRPASARMRMYDGEGIEVQPGKSTYFDSTLEYSEFDRGSRKQGV